MPENLEPSRGGRRGKGDEARESLTLKIRIIRQRQDYRGQRIQARALHLLTRTVRCTHPCTSQVRPECLSNPTFHTLSEPIPLHSLVGRRPIVGVDGLGHSHRNTPDITI